MCLIYLFTIYLANMEGWRTLVVFRKEAFLERLRLIFRAIETHVVHIDN